MKEGKKTGEVRVGGLITRLIENVRTSVTMWPIVSLKKVAMPVLRWERDSSYLWLRLPDNSQYQEHNESDPLGPERLAFI